MAGASSACSSGSPPPVGDGCVDFDVQLLGLALHEGFKLKDVSKEDWSSSGVCVRACVEKFVKVLHNYCVMPQCAVMLYAMRAMLV